MNIHLSFRLKGVCYTCTIVLSVVADSEAPQDYFIILTLKIFRILQSGGSMCR